MVILPVALGACDVAVDGRRAPSDSRPTTTVTASVSDSAGVQLVHSPGPTGGSWSLDPQPLADIRPGSSAPEALLFRVVGVALLLDGTVAVANLGDNTFRRYTATGGLLWTVGGSGGGPGEFRQVRGLLRRGSELLAFQPLPEPAKRFDLEGRYLGSVATPPGSGPRVGGVLADGSVIATLPYRTFPVGEGTDSAAVVRFSAEGLDTIAILPSLRRIPIDGIGSEAQALGPSLHVAVSDSLVYGSWATEPDIGVWREGRLIRRIRWAAERVPVTAHHREGYRETLLREGGDDPRRIQAFRALADGMVYPERHPAHARLLADAVGRLWVERAQTEPPWNEGIDYAPVPPHPTPWDIFSAGGEWLATVTLPARFRVLEVGEEYVAGVAKDDLDVESVQVWRVHRN